MMWSTLSTPFELMSEEQVIALLCSWTERELRPGEDIRLRLIDEQTSGVYEVTLKARSGCIYVTDIYPRPDLKGQPCYSWPTDFNLGALTRATIYASMSAADDLLELEISSDFYGYLSPLIYARIKEPKIPIKSLFEQLSLFL